MARPIDTVSKSVRIQPVMIVQHVDLPASRMFRAEPRMIAAGDRRRTVLRQSSDDTNSRGVCDNMFRCLLGRWAREGIALTPQVSYVKKQKERRHERDLPVPTTNCQSSSSRCGMRSLSAM